jgi:DUF1365 family protein
MKILNSRLFEGWIRHRRFLPKNHVIRYPVFMIWLDLDELEQVMAKSRFWSLQRFNLVSFYRSDYLGNIEQTMQRVSKRIRENCLRAESAC